MLNKITKFLLSFGMVLVLFLGTLSSLAFLKLHWEHEVADDVAVEVSLPVIYWDLYLELSKKPD